MEKNTGIKKDWLRRKGTEMTRGSMEINLK